MKAIKIVYVPRENHHEKAERLPLGFVSAGMLDEVMHAVTEIYGQPSKEWMMQQLLSEVSRLENAYNAAVINFNCLGDASEIRKVCGTANNLYREVIHFANQGKMGNEEFWGGLLQRIDSIWHDANLLLKKTDNTKSQNDPASPKSVNFADFEDVLQRLCRNNDQAAGLAAEVMNGSNTKPSARVMLEESIWDLFRESVALCNHMHAARRACPKDMQEQLVEMIHIANGIRANCCSMCTGMHTQEELMKQAQILYRSICRIARKIQTLSSSAAESEIDEMITKLNEIHMKAGALRMEVSALREKDIPSEGLSKILSSIANQYGALKKECEELKATAKNRHKRFDAESIVRNLANCQSKEELLAQMAELQKSLEET